MRILILLCIFAIQIAHADDMRPTSLTIQANSETRFDVVFKVPASGNRVVNLNVEFDDTVKTTSAPINYFTSDAYVQTWTIERKQGIGGVQMSIKGLERNSADVLVRIVDDDGNNQTSVLNIENPMFTVPEKLSSHGAFITYVKIGIDHILVGLDHLLFVACLIFISSSARTLVQTITGFTIAHSVTLILAATGKFEFPVAPVEAVIALSIVFLAWEIAKGRKDSLSLKYPMLVSSSFGLLHGFGFATVLGDIGLPDDSKLVALLAFNVGVEIGQLLFVGCLTTMFILLGKVYDSCNKAELRLYVSYSCGVIATFWLFERLSTFNLSI